MLVLKSENNLKGEEKHIRLLEDALKRTSKHLPQITTTVKRVTNEYDEIISNLSFTIHVSCPNLKTQTFNYASSGKWIPVGGNHEEEKNDIVVIGIYKAYIRNALQLS